MKSVAIIIIALLAFAGFPPGIGRAQGEKLKLSVIKGADDRALIRSADYPWRAIGRVNRRTGGFCTGTVIGPRAVLTAAHCLWNTHTRAWLPAQPLHFIAGYSLGEYVVETRIEEYRVAPGYRFNRQPTPEQAVSDWALLTTVKDIGAITGTISLQAATADAISRMIDDGSVILQAG